MHFIPLTAPEQAIGSNEQFVPLSPRGTSGERAGERGTPHDSASSPRPSPPSAGGEGATATRHEHREHHRARLCLAGALIISCVQIATAADADRVQNASSGQTNHHAGSRELELQGKVVCLPEEMHRVYQTDLPTNHEHIYGFKTTNSVYYTLLRTKLSEALFADPRLREKELLLTGNVPPKSQIFDVTKMKSIRNGAVYDLYYYCDICAIRTVAPGPCVCCQAPVELVEEPLESGSR
jgi:hypothetical protein